MLVWLVLLVTAAVIAGFVWNYRRQAAARETASAERMKAFLEQSRSNNAAHPVVPSDSANEPVVKPIERDLKAQPNVSGYTLRAPLLAPPQRTLFHLLKIGLPEHEVFACVSLAAFIQPAENLTGFAREAQERRLADAVVDFVVCDKSMKAVVAVQCGVRSSKAAENAAFAATCIASTGLRWVEISPDALPRRDEIRQRVLGA